MTELAGKVIEEINNLRKDPTCYVPKLEALLKKFDNDDDPTLFNEGDDMKRQTKDGRDAIYEAIKVLNEAESRHELVHNPLLDRAAHAHVADIGPKGKLENGDVEKRLLQHGRLWANYGQCIAFRFTDAEDIVCQLLVSDGLANDPHRVNLFRKEFLEIGVATGDCKTNNFFAKYFKKPGDGLKNICVVNLSMKYMTEAEFNTHAAEVKKWFDEPVEPYPLTEE